MNSPAFFVDGQTEQRALFNLCPGNPIRLIGCNGKFVKIEVIAKRISTLIKALNNRHHPIVILVDREGRENSVESIRDELFDAIQGHGIKDEIIIGVCDRMIENWILADRKNVEKYVGSKRKLGEANYEGAHGKSKIKRYYSNYHETTDGVKMLTSSNPKTMYGNSSSFKQFADSLKPIDCNWLKSVFTNDE